MVVPGDRSGRRLVVPGGFGSFGGSLLRRKSLRENTPEGDSPLSNRIDLTSIQPCKFDLVGEVLCRSSGPTGHRTCRVLPLPNRTAFGREHAWMEVKSNHPAQPADARIDRQVPPIGRKAENPTDLALRE